MEKLEKGVLCKIIKHIMGLLIEILMEILVKMFGNILMEKGIKMLEENVFCRILREIYLSKY